MSSTELVAVVSAEQQTDSTNAADSIVPGASLSDVSEMIERKMTEQTDEGTIPIALNTDIYNGAILLVTSGIWEKRMDVWERLSMAFLCLSTMAVQMTVVLTLYWGPTKYEETRNPTPFWIRCFGVATLMSFVGQMFREGTVIFALMTQFTLPLKSVSLFFALYVFNSVLFFYSVIFVQRLIQYQEDPVDAVLQVVAVHFINEIDDYMLRALQSPVSLYLDDAVFSDSFQCDLTHKKALNVFGEYLPNIFYIVFGQIVFGLLSFLTLGQSDHKGWLDFHDIRSYFSGFWMLLPFLLALAKRRDDPVLRAAFFFICTCIAGLFVGIILAFAGVRT